MVKFKNRSVLSGMTVHEAMQRQVVQLPQDASISQCIRHIIKFKANAVLVTGTGLEPVGVVSKTDIVAAYYAGLPIDTTLSDIMVGPPHFCHPSNSLETAIDLMQRHSIHQIYVQSEAREDMLGQAAYSDIVGLLYRYCRTCIRSGRRIKTIEKKEIPRLLVKDVMTDNVTSCHAAQIITGVIETLAGQKLGALLVTGSNQSALGAISKTDLVLAYIRGTDISESADTIMHSPVAACDATTLLSDAIQMMFLSDIQRIFVRNIEDGCITGVLSLSDATRFRSGTCRACGAGRILDQH